jgi:gamma-glutamylcyclotransferase (GGCT)/AIG2-like uncharacterized protein YtfP
MKELVFVYGTLLTGQYNHAHWLAKPGASLRGRGRVLGHSLFVQSATAAFPYAMEAKRGVVQGELWEVTAKGLERLDQLEGIDSGLYERAQVTAFVDGKMEKCWIYRRRELRRPIPIGDSWLKFCEERGH